MCFVVGKQLRAAGDPERPRSADKNTFHTPVLGPSRRQASCFACWGELPSLEHLDSGKHVAPPLTAVFERYKHEEIIIRQHRM